MEITFFYFKNKVIFLKIPSSSSFFNKNNKPIGITQQKEGKPNYQHSNCFFLSKCDHKPSNVRHLASPPNHAPLHEKKKPETPYRDLHFPESNARTLLTTLVGNEVQELDNHRVLTVKRRHQTSFVSNPQRFQEDGHKTPLPSAPLRVLQALWRAKVRPLWRHRPPPGRS